MARYTGPMTRKSRRLGVDLVGGDAAFEKRPYAPGQHGRARSKEGGPRRRAADWMVERYTGHVSTLSKWNYEVREHGSHCYYLLIEPAVIPDEGASDSEAADIAF